jgi:hypothetical protein
MKIRRPELPSAASNHQEVAKQSSTNSTSKSISHGVSEAKDSFESAKSNILNFELPPADIFLVKAALQSKHKEEGALAKEKESGLLGPVQNNSLTDQAAKKPLPSASHDTQTITQSPFKKDD